jgi:hypothetical protein
MPFIACVDTILNIHNWQKCVLSLHDKSYFSASCEQCFVNRFNTADPQAYFSVNYLSQTLSPLTSVYILRKLLGRLKRPYLEV